MRAGLRTFAEEFDRVLVKSDTSVRRLARLTGVSRRTLENWLYNYSTGPRYVDPILQVARALQLHAVDSDRLLIAAGHPSLTRLRQSDKLPPDILLAWQLPPDSRMGQKKSALQHAQQLLKQMPWNEELQREVMVLLALNGRRSEALNQFEICKKALREELGVEPTAETLALYERIRRTAHFSHDNIPAVTTPLIGREEELETLSAMLADPTIRLITLTGLGGTGKTRVALDLAWRHTAGQFADGVTFVQLAALESVEQIVMNVAQALHLPLAGADEVQARMQLLDYLKPKQMLLVFDNCEHLLDGMAILTTILEAAPQMQILATSRERLRLRAEYLFPLQGLPYSETGRDHPAALLVESSARRINPNFEITAHNSALVNQLCHLVGGLPLALELAASRLDTTSVDTVVAEIESSLDFLAIDLHDMPARHRSLRAVLESTWQRLDSQTRQAYAALSVFRGSFSADAALAVAGADPALLTRLTAHSLLELDREADRYQLHEMLRQFAAEKLNSMPDHEEMVNRRHFATYNDLAGRGRAEMRGDQVTWMMQLELEEENIRKALDWAMDNDPKSAAELSLVLHQTWISGGRYREAARRYERLALHMERLPAAIRPWLLVSHAETLRHLGRAQEMSDLISAALPLFLELGDNNGTAFVYLLQSLKARDHEVIDVSIQLAQTGLHYAQTSGIESNYETLLLESLSDSLTRSGRFEEAEALIQQGYQLCLDRDDQLGANAFLGHKIFLADSLGRAAEARLLGEEYLTESRRLGMLSEELTALDHLGVITYDDGDLDQSELYTADALSLAREAHNLPSLASLDLNMSEILMSKGAYVEALPFLREAIFLVQEIGNETRIALTMEVLSRWLWYSDKQALNAVRWNARAKARLEASGQLRLPYELAIYARTKEDMEATLGQETLARLVSEGESMPLEEVLDELLHALAQQANRTDKHMP